MPPASPQQPSNGDFVQIAPDATELHALLTSAELPVADLDAHTPGFVLARIDGDGLACAGMVQTFEAEPEWALLRSIAVRADLRGRRLATALVDQLEQWSALQGRRHLVLMTTDAQPFFERRGYQPIERDQLPAAVTSHPQFSGLCPSATTMMRQL